jgi:hypothetical protein
VFGGENRQQLHLGGFEKQINGAPPFGVEAGVIGDETDTLFGKGRELVGGQNIDAGLNPTVPQPLTGKALQQFMMAGEGAAGGQNVRRVAGTYGRGYASIYREYVCPPGWTVG